MRVISRLLVILIILVFLSELFVRKALILPTSSVSDRELGWVYKPYATVFHTSEGRAINKMNSIGFNDSDINVGKTHVLVLGDSFTEALQVPRAENFTSITEVMAPCLDVYNAGRSRLSPIHYPTVLSRVTKHITPKLAVIVVTASDMSDIKKSNYEIIRDEAGKHIIGLSLKEKSLTRLRIKLDPILSRSALATYLMGRAKALLLDKNINGMTKAKSEVATSDDNKLIHEILVYLFNNMNSKTPIAVLYHPNMEYGVNRVASVDKHSEEFEQIIKDAANIAGVPVSSTKAYMKASYYENGQPGTGFSNKNILFGHLNRLGHHATASALHELVTNFGLQCSPTKNL